MIVSHLCCNLPPAGQIWPNQAEQFCPVLIEWAHRDHTPGCQHCLGACWKIQIFRLPTWRFWFRRLKVGLGNLNFNELLCSHLFSTLWSSFWNMLSRYFVVFVIWNYGPRRCVIIKIATMTIIIPCLSIPFPPYAVLCEINAAGLLFPFQRRE